MEETTASLISIMNIFKELNEEIFGGQAIEATVHQTTPFRSPLDPEIFKYTEFVKTAVETKYLIDGVALVKKLEPKLAKNDSLFVKMAPLKILG